ncbi:MAG: hypothetical protein COA47_08425 [Robiginitomaculum sp.]|nr:MAG: hypothetical protein COA47_08425 [Robiginitomaculum sp.]
MRGLIFAFRLILAAAIVAANSAAMLYLARLWTAEQFVQQQMAARGIDCRLQITRFDHLGLDAQNIILSSGLRADHMSVAWTSAGLGQKQLGPIVISGASIAFTQSKIGWQIGGIDLRDLLPDESQQSTWKVQHIAVQSAKVQLRSEGERVTAILDLDRTQQGAISFNLRDITGQAALGGSVLAIKQGAIDGQLTGADFQIVAAGKLRAKQTDKAPVSWQADQLKFSGSFDNSTNRITTQIDFDLLATDLSHQKATGQSLIAQGQVDLGFNRSGPNRRLKISGTTHVKLDGVDLTASEPLQVLSQFSLAKDLQGFSNQLETVLKPALNDLDLELQTHFTMSGGRWQFSNKPVEDIWLQVKAPNLDGQLQSTQMSWEPGTSTFTMESSGQLNLENFSSTQFSELALHGKLGKLGKPLVLHGSVTNLTTQAKTTLRRFNLSASQVLFSKPEQNLRLSADVKVRWDGQLAGLQIRNGDFRGRLSSTFRPGLTQVSLRDKTANVHIDQLKVGAWIGQDFSVFLLASQKPVFLMDTEQLELSFGVRTARGRVIKQGLSDFSVSIFGQIGQAELHFRKAGPAGATLTTDLITMELSGEDHKKITLDHSKIVAKRKQGAWTGSGMIAQAQLHSDRLPVEVSSAQPGFSFELRDTGLVVMAKHLNVDLFPKPEFPNLPPVMMHLNTHLADGGIIGTGRTRLSKENTDLGTIDFTHDLASGSGEFTANNTDLFFSPSDLQPKNLIPTLTGLVANVQGSTAYHFTGAWDRTGLTRTGGDLDLLGLDFDMLLGRIEAVTGQIQFSSLVPLRTRAPANIKIGIFDPGIVLENGQIDFDLKQDGFISIQQASWPFAGGEMQVIPMDWEIGGMDQMAELVLRDIDLLELTGLVGFKDLSAEGKMSGRIPLRITENTIFVEQAKLSAVPPGVLRYTGSVGDDAGQAAPQAQMAFDLLKNLHFEQLELTLDGDVAGRMDAGLVIEGSNPDVIYGVPFLLRVNTSAEFARLARQATEGLRIANTIGKAMEQQLDNSAE